MWGKIKLKIMKNKLELAFICTEKVYKKLIGLPKEEKLVFIDGNVIVYKFCNKPFECCRMESTTGYNILKYYKLETIDWVPDWVAIGGKNTKKLFVYQDSYFNDPECFYFINKNKSNDSLNAFCDLGKFYSLLPRKEYKESNPFIKTREEIIEILQKENDGDGLNLYVRFPNGSFYVYYDCFYDFDNNEILTGLSKLCIDNDTVLLKWALAEDRDNTTISELSNLEQQYLKLIKR